MAKFNYKKWITENKYGKLNEQGTADFKEEKDDTKEESKKDDTKGESKKDDTKGESKKDDTKGKSKKDDTKGKSKKDDTKGESKKEDGLENPKKADLNKDGKLSDYEEKRGAAIEKNMKEYKAGRTQGNGNPLLPEQIFGMQHSSKQPKQESCNEMMGYYEQMGCGGIQEMYKEYYYENKKLMTKENGTGPYQYSNVMQEGDNPEQQGRLVSMMNYLSELAPSGCNEMAKIQEINGNFNLHETKIKKKITKRALKNIIKEELKKSLLKEQECQPTTPCGSKHQWSTTECKCVPLINEQEVERGCLNPTQSGATNVGDCCPDNTYAGCVATSHYEPCCKYDNIGTGSDDPCLDTTNPEQPNCWYCKSNDCQQTGIMPFMTNADASAAGFSLYLNQALCNSSEDACGDSDPISEECGCCCDMGPGTMGEQIGSIDRKTPINNPAEPSPDGCKPGTQEPAIYNATAGRCICPPGKTEFSSLPCKGQGTPPYRPGLSTEIEQSQRLRESIYSELFGKGK